MNRRNPQNNKKRIKKTFKASPRVIYQRRVTTAIASVFFLLAALHAVYYFMSFLTSSEIETTLITLGSVDRRDVFEGVIIRDETVYFAERSGALVFHESENSRVRPGALTASIQESRAIAEINASLASLEAEILAAHYLRSGISRADPHVARINAGIENAILERLPGFALLNMRDVYAAIDAIKTGVNNRNRLIISENLAEGNRLDLIGEHDRLTNHINQNTAPIFIERGGILSRLVDGFEERLTTENARFLTPEETRLGLDASRVLPRREVARGEPAFKIAHSSEWRIVAHLPPEAAANMSVGAETEIFVLGRRALRVTPEYINETPPYVLVVLTSREFISDFLDMRSILFQTDINIQNGLRVPNTAFVEKEYVAIPARFLYEDDFGGVFALRAFGEDILKIEVNSKYFEDEYILVEAVDGLETGVILTDGAGNLYQIASADMRTITGIYLVVGGVARFTVVSAPETRGSLFTALDMSENPRLSAGQQIVARSEDAYDGAIVFGSVR